MTDRERGAYIAVMSMAATSNEKRLFTLHEAQELLPVVKKITASVVDQVNTLVERLELMTEEDPEFEETRTTLEATVRAWAEKLQKLGCEVKGLWLVDFDNGQGYYCWSHPEEELDHFHGYEEGFSNRTLIC